MSLTLEATTAWAVAALRVIEAATDVVQKHVDSGICVIPDCETIDALDRAIAAWREQQENQGGDGQ